MTRFFFLLALLAALPAQADERISVCFNYGCTAKRTVRYTDAQLATVRRMLLAANSPVLERKVLGGVVGQLYRWAGEQTPIRVDRAGNRDDDAINGSMDCIDHSTTTTRFLKMLERRRWMRYHRTLPVVERKYLLVFSHFSAAIQLAPLPVPALPSELSDMYLAEEDESRFVVDSWLVDHGQPAIVLPLEEWMDGGGPDVGL